MAKKITKEMYDKINDLFPKWKELNKEIKENYSRGINFHEAFSEIMVGWKFKLLLEEGGSSADLVDKNGLKYQVKGSSNYKNDLSTFGPRSEFDVLFYCGLNEEMNTLYVWKIDIDFLNKIKVNKDKTFREFQNLGKRPRFSIYKKIIKPNNLEPIEKIEIED